MDSDDEEVSVVFHGHGIDIESPEIDHQNQNTSQETTSGPELCQSTNRRSKLWTYFDKIGAGKYVQCKICSSKLARGIGSSTTPMKNHLRLKHKKQYEEFLIASQTAVQHSQREKQQTVDKLINEIKWKIDDRKAEEMHYMIAEMIAIDNQPISFVENKGFRRVMSKAIPHYTIPGRTFFTDNIIPKIYGRCKTVVQKLVATAGNLSITIDIWTETHSNESFISLTAHFLDKDFTFRHIFLNMKHFPGTHSGETISEMMNSLLKEWNIVSEKLHIILRDNAANIVKGLKDAGLPHESCFIHTLQLAIKDSMDAQRTVIDTIAVCRNIVSHFNRSSLACSKLKLIQTDLAMKQKKLIQDVSTRWNSTFYMLQSILEQKRCLTILDSETNQKEITILNDNQWSILEGVISLLSPFEEEKNIASQADALISSVIPTIATLKCYLGKENPVHFGVGTMKATLKDSISNRFSNLIGNKNYTISTYLDPRFQMKFFEQNLRKKITTTIIDEFKKLKPDRNQSALDPKESTVPTFNRSVHSSYWDSYKEISTGNISVRLESKTEQPVTESTNKDSIIVAEMSLYTSLALLDRKESPLAWWATNKSIFPNLSKLAQKYLGAPSSTVYSELLFSEAGTIYEDTRNRLLPRHGECLAFLNCNLQRINFQY